MSEKAPAPESALSPAAQAEVARIQAEVDQKKLDVESQGARQLAKVIGEESFGKYDVEPTVRVPGELTHSEYHAQRPSEGIYRDGNVLRSASNSQFVSTEDYIAQTGADNLKVSADKYYDELHDLNATEAEGSEASATPERPDYSKMETDQLVFATAAALELGDKAEVADIRKAYETPFLEEVTRPGTTMDEAEYNAALAHFDKLVSIAVQYERAKSTTSPEQFKKIDKIVAKNERDPSPVDKLKSFWGKIAEGSKKTWLKPEWWGARWTMVNDAILNVGVKPDMDPATVEKTKKRNRVVFILGASAVAIGTILVVGNLNAVDHSGEVANALPPNTGGGGGESSEATSILDQLSAQNAGTGSEGNDPSSILNQLSDQNEALGNKPELREPTSVFDAFRQPVGTGTVLVEPGVAEAAIPTAAVETASIDAAAVFNIPDGGGGYELFGKLGLEPSVWADNAKTLLENFPSDFMRLPDNSIGISHPGYLSQGAQDAINALRP